jgi:ssDNA-binding Zn-finger/Zn-ribbon topoisomerase 1
MRGVKTKKGQTLIKCDNCQSWVKPAEMVRFKWKKKNVNLDLCPNCIEKIYQKHLEDVSINKEAMVKSGFYQQGAREVDFKSYLWKWAKKLKEKL